MSINYYQTVEGDFTLHVEQWCDGGTWVTKNGDTLDTRSMFYELVKKDKCIVELEKRLSDAETESTKEQSIRDLEQQLLVVKRIVIKADHIPTSRGLVISADSIKDIYNDLHEKAKALKEKG